MGYGVELIMDLASCDVGKFNRKEIKSFLNQLCELIDMKPFDLHFWDDLRIPVEDRQTDPKTKGTTAVQFILTSNITIHTLDLLQSVFVNIFSCKDYDTKQVEDFTVGFFKAKRHRATVVERGE